MGLHISCKQATTYIVKKEEGKISLYNRLQLWLHLGICGLCKLFMKQNKLINQSAGELDNHTNSSLSTEEKNTIIRYLNQAG